MWSVSDKRFEFAICFLTAHLREKDTDSGIETVKEGWMYLILDLG